MGEACPKPETSRRAEPDYAAVEVCTLVCWQCRVRDRTAPSALLTWSQPRSPPPNCLIDRALIAYLDRESRSTRRRGQKVETAGITLLSAVRRRPDRHHCTFDSLIRLTVDFL